MPRYYKVVAGLEITLLHKVLFIPVKHNGMCFCDRLILKCLNIQYKCCFSTTWMKYWFIHWVAAFFFLLITCACLKDLLISTFRNLTCSFCHSVCTGCSVCPGFVFFRIFYILWVSFWVIGLICLNCRCLLPKAQSQTKLPSINGTMEEILY